MPRLEPQHPERALVLAYAPRTLRVPLATLWRLDERLDHLADRDREPMLGRIRLAWWREALERLDEAPPPAEPILAAVAESVLPRGVSGRALSPIADGWSTLLDRACDADAVERFAAMRGGTIFVATATAAGLPTPADLAAGGEHWALIDLAQRTLDRALRAAAFDAARSRAERFEPWRWPKALRPLAALAILARNDMRFGRLDIHPGSPRRVARLALAGLTGR